MPQAAAYVAAWWASLSAVQATIAVLQFLAVANSVYGGIQARRKAKRAAQQQRDAYNASLSDRTVNLLGADNPRPIIYGEATVGCSFAALLTSGPREEFKHLVGVWAAHECSAVLDFYINGQGVGGLDPDGYPRPGSRWFRETQETSTQSVVLAAGGTLTVSMPILALLAVGRFYPAGGSGESSTSEQTIPLDVDTCTVAGNVVTVPSPFSTDDVGATFIVSYLSPRNQTTVRVRHHLGQPGQQADAELIAAAPGQWSATDRGAGMCYSWVRLDLNEPEFQGGPPQMTALLRGKKLYDPRLDSTQPGGNGPQRFEDPSTHTFSRNPALATADFICAPYGKRALKQHVNWPSVMAAANACDVVVSYGGTNQALYTCNGSFSTGQDPDATLEALCQSMAGFATLSGGWFLQAGAYTAPVMALTEADNDGPVELVPIPGLLDVANGLRGRFYDPERYSQLTDYPPYLNAGFVAADNGVEAWEQLDMPFTDSALRCHQLARVLIEGSRGTALRFPAKKRALALRPGQRVTLMLPKLGLLGEVYRVVKTEYADGAPVMLSLVRDDPSFYDLVDAPAPLALPAATRQDPWRVDPVLNLVASTGAGALELDADGQVLGRVLLTLAASTDVLVRSGGALQVEYRRHTDAPDTWRRHPEEPGTATSVRLPLRENTQYLVRARWRNLFGVPGEWAVLAVLTEASTSISTRRFSAYVEGPVSFSTVT